MADLSELENRIARLEQIAAHQAHHPEIQLTGYVRTFEETWPRDSVEGLELTANRFEATEDP